MRNGAAPIPPPLPPLRLRVTSSWNFATHSPSRCLPICNVTRCRRYFREYRRASSKENPSRGCLRSVKRRCRRHCSADPSLLRRPHQPSVVSSPSSPTSRSVASSSPRPSRKSPQQAARLLALRVPQRYYAGSYTHHRRVAVSSTCRPACRPKALFPPVQPEVVSH